MKIKFYPYQPHCFAFGGFDLQMLNALDSIEQMGVNVSKLDVWSRDFDFDIIHIWGIGPRNYHVIDWAKKAGKKVVATVLIPYFDTFRLKLSHYKNFFSEASKQRIYYYSLIDKIVVVNELQSAVLTKYYKVNSSKIDVIPNIVEDKYFVKPTVDLSKKIGIDRYVLCTGNICARKNQINLAQACINLNLKLVLIGNILDGEKSYAIKLEKLIHNNDQIIWIKELPKAADELVAAYYNCLIFALPSLDETQPISALEAIAMGKPLVLLDKKYAHQNLYKGANLCKSGAVIDIEKALLKTINYNYNVTRSAEIEKCKFDNVGIKYINLYRNLF